MTFKYISGTRKWCKILLGARVSIYKFYKIMLMNNERLNIFKTSGAEQNVKLFAVDLFESLNDNWGSLFGDIL